MALVNDAPLSVSRPPAAPPSALPVVRLETVNVILDGNSGLPAAGVALRAGWDAVKPGDRLLKVDDGFRAEAASRGAAAADRVLAQARDAFLAEGALTRLADIVSRIQATKADITSDELLASQHARDAKQAIRALAPLADVRRSEGWSREANENVRLQRQRLDILQAMYREEAAAVKQRLTRALHLAAARFREQHEATAGAAAALAMKAFSPPWRTYVEESAHAASASHQVVAGFVESLTMPEPAKPAPEPYADLPPGVAAIVAEMG